MGGGGGWKLNVSSLYRGTGSKWMYFIRICYVVPWYEKIRWKSEKVVSRSVFIFSE